VFINLSTNSIIVVYVNDLILITRSKASITQLKEQLLKRYKSRNLGLVGFYLSIRVLCNRPNRSISLSIDSYVNRVVEEYYLTNSLPANTPLPKLALTLTKREDKADVNLIVQYQSLVAKLLYPTLIMRPNLA
jgi:hypothetical protein